MSAWKSLPGEQMNSRDSITDRCKAKAPRRSCCALPLNLIDLTGHGRDSAQHRPQIFGGTRIGILRITLVLDPGRVGSERRHAGKTSAACQLSGNVTLAMREAKTLRTIDSHAAADANDMAITAATELRFCRLR